MQVIAYARPSGRQTSSSTNRVVADALKVAPIDETDGLPSWAIVEEQPLPDEPDKAKNVRAKSSNRASLIKRGRLGPFKPSGTFDARSRTEAASVDENGEPSPEKVVRVYARYLGEEYADEVPAVEDVAHEPVAAAV